VPALAQGRPKGREEKYSLSQLVSHLAAALGTGVRARLLCVCQCVSSTALCCQPLRSQAAVNCFEGHASRSAYASAQPPAAARMQVQFVDDCIGPKVANRVDALQPGQVRSSAANGIR